MEVCLSVRYPSSILSCVIGVILLFLFIFCQLDFIFKMHLKYYNYML